MSKKNVNINNKTLILKGLFTLLGGLCLAIIAPIVVQQSKIILFYFFISFSLVFILIGIIFLIKKMKILESSEALLTKILNSRKRRLQSSSQNVFYNPMYFYVFLIVLILLNIILSNVI